MKEMEAFRGSLDVLENERLFSKYPQAISNLFEKVMTVDDGPKESLYNAVLKGLKKEFLNYQTIRDWLQFRKL